MNTLNSSNKTVLLLYRRMLYSLMEVFRGDYVTFHTTRITIRREIEKRRDLKDPKEIREKILDLEEARNTISSNIMQGKLQDNGHYRYKAREDHIVTASVKPDVLEPKE